MQRLQRDINKHEYIYNISSYININKWPVSHLVKILNHFCPCRPLSFASSNWWGTPDLVLSKLRQDRLSIGIISRALHAGMKRSKTWKLPDWGSVRRRWKEAVFDEQVLDCGKCRYSRADGFPRSLNFANGYLANMNIIYEQIYGVLWK